MSDKKEVLLCDCVDFENGVGGNSNCQKCYGSGWVTKHDICPVCRAEIDEGDKLSFRVVEGKTIHERCMAEEIESVQITHQLLN